ncbi:MAG: outer membrane beta-barrel protein [Gammaproteobacteria bacterium]|nr:outer membrane beta-barrel protein [Gammaproteobacteria bacterium]
MKPFFLPEFKGGHASSGTVLGAFALLMVTASGPAYAAEDGSGAYAGVFVGSGEIDNRLTDVSGFAYPVPGWVTRYGDAGFIGGVLIGKKFDLGGATIRLELDGTIGDLEAQTNQLGPRPWALDETAVVEFQWITTARVGIEKSFGSVTVFATGGLARARIENFVVDVDFGLGRPRTVDPDDSFHDRSTETGWVIGLGAEIPLTGGWVARLEGLIWILDGTFIT